MIAGLRIVSGGQTGADRAALDAALAAGVPCGGWCPAGRRAEDGVIPARYPLVELAGGGYPARTRRNVVDSDGTVVMAYGPPTGGTRLTVDLCRQVGRPYLVVDAELATAGEAASADGGVRAPAPGLAAERGGATGERATSHLRVCVRRRRPITGAAGVIFLFGSGPAGRYTRPVPPERRGDVSLGR